MHYDYNNNISFSLKFVQGFYSLKSEYLDFSPEIPILPSMRITRPIKAAIFDMDGTIFATERLYHAAWRHAMEVLGINHIPDHTFGRLVGMRVDDCMRILSDHIPCQQTMGQLVDLADVQFVKLISNDPIPFKEGIHELLDYVKGLGLPCAVATNSEKSRAQLKLKSRGLFDRFRTVVGGECVHHPKPAPDVYLKAAESLEVPPEACLAFEDSAPGVASAYQAGMTVLMIPDMVDPTDEARAQAHAVLPNCFEVIEFLKKNLY